MDHFEMTEKLRERAQVSYEEAKEALELNEWDMLEAIVYLEREGKTRRADGTGEQPQEKTHAKTESRQAEKKHRVSGNLFETAANALANRVVEKGNRNRLEIYREGKVAAKLPLTVVVLVTLCMFWVVVPAMFIGWIAWLAAIAWRVLIDKAQNNGEVV